MFDCKLTVWIWIGALEDKDFDSNGTNKNTYRRMAGSYS